MALFDDMLNLLQPVKKSGDNQWKALCPCHSDKNPSLSIRQYPDGKFSVLCFGCGAKNKEVFAALNLNNGFKDTSTNIIEKIYNYPDESGKIIHRTIRYRPKNFSQQRPDGKGNWLNNLDNVQTVLYNLPLVIKSSQVIIVEGEKDCDALNNLDFCATTNPMGAGKWKPHFNPFLRDKDIILIPDNDKPGKEHALSIANQLYGIVRSIKVIDLPGLPEKGDVSDFLNKFPDMIEAKKQLIDLINTTKEWAKPAPVMVISTWDEPIPLSEVSSLPSFPVETLPIPFREFVQSVSAVTQVDICLPGCICLGVLSSCLHKKAKVNLSSHQEPLGLYIAAVADVGERKSSTLGIFTAPLYDHQSLVQNTIKENNLPNTELHEQNKHKIKSLKDKLAKTDDIAVKLSINEQINALSQEIVNNPIHKVPTFVLDDVTPEALGRVMSFNDERISILSSEGGIFSIMDGRYSNNLNIDLFLKAYSGDAYSTERIGRDPVSMFHPSLSMLLTVQPETINNIGQVQAFRGRGLLSRFLFVSCKPRAGFRFRQFSPVPPILQTNFNSAVFKLLYLESTDSFLNLSEKADSLWTDFYNYVESLLRYGGMLYNLKDWGSKLSGNVARIAGLLHFAKHLDNASAHEISDDTMNAAIMLGNFFIDHARFTFSVMHEDVTFMSARKILNYISNSSASSFTVRDLMRHISSFSSKNLVLPAIKLLIEHGYIKESIHDAFKQPGRPEAVSYLINPLIHNPKPIDNNDKTLRAG